MDGKSNKKLGDDKLGISSILASIEKTMGKPAPRLMPNKGPSFLRVKYHKGRPYWYRVQSYWKDGRSHQRVLEYLGPRKPRSKGGSQ